MEMEFKKSVIKEGTVHEAGEKVEITASDLIKIAENLKYWPYAIRIAEQEEKYLKLEKENELLKMNIDCYIRMLYCPKIPSLADIQLAQIQSTKIYKFFAWWLNLIDKIKNLKKDKNWS